MLNPIARDFAHGFAFKGASGLPSSSSTPPPAPPPTPPTALEVTQAKVQTRRDSAKRRGLASTLLSGPEAAPGTDRPTTLLGGG